MRSKAKRKTSRQRVKSKVMLSRTSILVRLTPAQRKRAEACLERTGKVTFSMKRHVATKLPQVLSNGVLID
jgi:hypothetical protein